MGGKYNFPRVFQHANCWKKDIISVLRDGAASMMKLSPQVELINCGHLISVSSLSSVRPAVEHREENLHPRFRTQSRFEPFNSKSALIFEKTWASSSSCFKSRWGRRGRFDQIPGKDLNQQGSAAGRPQGRLARGHGLDHTDVIST